MRSRRVRVSKLSVAAFAKREAAETTASPREPFSIVETLRFLQPRWGESALSRRTAGVSRSLNLSHSLEKLRFLDLPCEELMRQDIALDAPAIFLRLLGSIGHA